MTRRVLVIADPAWGGLTVGTRVTVSAASELGGTLDVLASGCDCDAYAAELAALEGVQRVRLLDAPHYAQGELENLALALAQLAGAYDYVLVPASVFGKALGARVAAMLDVAPVTDVIGIMDGETFRHPVYAGNLIETLRCAERVKLLSIRAGAFPPVARRADEPAPIERLAAGPDLGVSRVLLRTIADQARPELGSARIVVAGGKGLGSAEAFRNLLEPLATRLGAALAATRAAVDAGFAANAWQVGQTGRVIAPALYIAVGISGAAQHLAGMRGAGVIVAINTDPEAPLMQLADYSLVGSAEDILPALLAALG